jgi:serine/threonine protein kinase
VKLVDFGLCAVIDRLSTDKVGTPGFVAPEMFNNFGHDWSVDIFSLGVVLHTMLSGANPF